MLHLNYNNLPKMDVMFETDDRDLQEIYNMCEEQEKNNIVKFGDKNVLIEGSSWYRNVWLETQPMGGHMYAKRNSEVAINNQLIFLECQREDGRLPGMISFEEGKLKSTYAWFQGYCFPYHALKMYYVIGENKDYLKFLYEALKKQDDYIWKYRDSNGDGCLETWCVWDTGEDNCSRLEGAPNEWNEDTPPTGIGKVPYASMDFMGHSYDGRKTLAQISGILRNGEEQYWEKAAQAVRDKIKGYLWIDEKHACYDRDCDNQFMDTLLHNNLRVMYHGGFTQEMADAFIKYHLLNPDEFWTNVPLPSIAANDPLFNNKCENNWSGPSQGLTYQRAIRALENYGHYAEVTLLGKIFLDLLKKLKTFPQQFDPFTGDPGIPDSGYGPTILSCLEYISKLYGISADEKQIEWTSISTANCKYTQIIDNNRYVLLTEDKMIKGFINDEMIFQSDKNIRIITDLEGSIKEIVGMDAKTQHISIECRGKNFTAVIEPNHRYYFSEDAIRKLKCVSFDFPYKSKN